MTQLYGGPGGTGGGPNGVAGGSGADSKSDMGHIVSVVQKQYEHQAAGGAGGSNNATVTIAGKTFGPYGHGGAGGATSDDTNLRGEDGRSGGVVIWWGNPLQPF